MMQSWHIAPPCRWYRKIDFTFPSVNRNERSIFILQKEKILKIFEDRKSRSRTFAKTAQKRYSIGDKTSRRNDYETNSINLSRRKRVPLSGPYLAGTDTSSHRKVW